MLPEKIDHMQFNIFSKLLRIHQNCNYQNPLYLLECIHCFKIEFSITSKDLQWTYFLRNKSFGSPAYSLCACVCPETCFCFHQLQCLRCAQLINMTKHMRVSQVLLMQKYYLKKNLDGFYLKVNVFLSLKSNGISLVFQIKHNGFTRI